MWYWYDMWYDSAMSITAYYMYQIPYNVVYCRNTVLFSTGIVSTIRVPVHTTCTAIGDEKNATKNAKPKLTWADVLDKDQVRGRSETVRSKGNAVMGDLTLFLKVAHPAIEIEA